MTAPALPFTDIRAGYTPLSLLGQREYSDCSRRGIPFSAHGPDERGQYLWMYQLEEGHYVVLRVSGGGSRLVLEVEGIPLGLDWITSLLKRIR